MFLMMAEFVISQYQKQEASSCKFLFECIFKQAELLSQEQNVTLSQLHLRPQTIQRGGKNKNIT